MSVTLHTTLGALKLELYCADAPKSCENFLALCASGYYDGCAFHRCVKGFMIQSGDPTGTGRGGASIYGGHFADEVSARLPFAERGVLAMLADLALAWGCDKPSAEGAASAAG